MSWQMILKSLIKSSFKTFKTQKFPLSQNLASLCCHLVCFGFHESWPLWFVKKFWVYSNHLYSVLKVIKQCNVCEVVSWLCHNRIVTAIYNNVKERADRSFYLLGTHQGGLFQIDVFVWHFIVFLWPLDDVLWINFFAAILNEAFRSPDDKIFF